MVKISSIDPIKQKVTQLRNEVVYSALEGNYKKYKTALKENAKYTVANYDAIKGMAGPQIKVPLFSKYGLKMLKVMFLNFFRVKTPEEKLLKEIIKKEKLKQETDKFFNNKPSI